MSPTFVAAGDAFSADSAAAVESASPVNEVHEGSPPEYLVAGSDEPSAPTDVANFADLLNSLGVVSEVHIYQGGHEWSVWRQGLPGCLHFLLSYVPAS